MNKIDLFAFFIELRAYGVALVPHASLYKTIVFLQRLLVLYGKLTEVNKNNDVQRKRN